MQWDIFCRVIDNFGDIGICWRLAADLASRGQHVRLWTDDASALTWMAPDHHNAGNTAGEISILPWADPFDWKLLERLEQAPCDVLVEAFGCEPATEFIAATARIHSATGEKPVWINLEYLSAEPYAERNHLLPSPVQHGPAAGWIKWFFYPGFTTQTGGLLREPGLAARQKAFDPTSWLLNQGIDHSPDEMLVSLFCYEPAMLPQMLDQMSGSGLDGKPVKLLVATGRAQNAVRAALASQKGEIHNEKDLQPNVYGHGMLSISYLPLLTQTDFDHLLWACDVNFVRGEDSIVRALWAAKPFVWQIYPQDDGVHSVKLEAFLDLLEAPPFLRTLHQRWNAGAEDPAEVLRGGATLAAATSGENLSAWQHTVQAARTRLAGQEDLTGALMKFVEKNR